MRKSESLKYFESYKQCFNMHKQEESFHEYSSKEKIKIISDELSLLELILCKMICLSEKYPSEKLKEELEECKNVYITHLQEYLIEGISLKPKKNFKERVILPYFPI